MPEEFSTDESRGRDGGGDSDWGSLTNAQRNELDARIARYRHDPSGGIDWEDIKAILRTVDKGTRHGQ